MSSTASAVSSSHPGSGDPTPASMWLALGGCQITDQVLEWPPDLFALTDVILDSTRVVVGRTCHFRGTLIFRVPPDTLAVTWVGYPEQTLVYGWPATLGPFAGIGASRVGDSLAGAILFDSRLGVRARPGATARFVAGRARS